LAIFLASGEFHITPEGIWMTQKLSVDCGSILEVM